MDAARVIDEGYTVEDIYALPDGKRAEIIYGEWYDMATPNRIHQRIVTELAVALSNYIRGNKGKCEVDVAPFEVRLNKDDRTYLEPDITVVCDKSKLTDRGCWGAPDLVVEVTSPSTSDRDYGKKLFLYRTAGVREYWIIDPETETITTYVFDTDEEKEHASHISFDEELRSGIFDGFAVTLSELI